jgi:hypothetical protein
MPFVITNLLCGKKQNTNVENNGWNPGQFKVRSNRDIVKQFFGILQNSNRISNRQNQN